MRNRTAATDTRTGRSASAPPWHALPADEVRARLSTSDTGLTDAEAEARLVRIGPNEIPEEPPPGLLILLLRQFRSPLSYILFAALAISLLIGETVDAIVIAFALLLDATIGLYQERQAETSLRALRQLSAPHSRVIRDGIERDVPSRELVPGDVVLLESGTRVPADLRLTTTTSLLVDESLLTGESVPVTKHPNPVPETAPLGDRSSLAFSGTVVVSGRGRGYVVATGVNTELGAIAIAQGQEAVDMLLVAVALAVAAVPEGLPVGLTITLAAGVRRMARRNAIIRHLPAAETLGSTTVIGSDKTGTLTENRMTVRRVWSGGKSVKPGTTPTPSPESNSVRPGDPVYDTLLIGALTND